MGLLVLIATSERKRPRGQRNKRNSWPDWLAEEGGAEREGQPAARGRMGVEWMGSSSPAGPAAPGAVLCCLANPASSAREEGITVAYCRWGRRQATSSSAAASPEKKKKGLEIILKIRYCNLVICLAWIFLLFINSWFLSINWLMPECRKEWAD